MKWIKNGNQLINLGHVDDVSILPAEPHIVFWNEGAKRVATLKFDNLETAEAHLEAIAMFLENTHTSIMAMAPTIED